MTSDLRSQLQSALGSAYVIERELGGRYSALAYLYAALGDTTHALSAIDSASRGGGDLLLAQAINSPRFDPLRKSARFADAMRRYNLDLSRVTASDGGRSR